MKTTRRMTKALLWGVLFLLFTFISVSHAVAQTCVPPPSGLVSWWPFDETSGTTAADVQDGNLGTLIGGPTFTPGFVGNALDFTGVNAYVEIVNASNLNFGNGSFTVEAWFNYPTVPLGLVYLIDHGASNMVTPSEAGWAVFVTGGGQIGFDLRDQAGQVGGRPMGSAPAPSAGVWHQVVLVVDRANNLATLFVDGAPGASAMIPASFGSMNNNGNPAIGAINRGGAATGGSPGGFFNGLIDEVAIHNRALSDSEIQAIFNTCNPLPVFSCVSGGFKPPFDVQLTLKAKVKRAIPVKMMLTDGTNVITDQDVSAPVVNVMFSPAADGGGIDVTGDLLPLGAANEDNIFRYDDITQTWIYNLGTKPFVAAGTYEVFAVAGDVTYEIDGSCTGTFFRQD